jgi:3-oxoisoapionate decarboxylase
MRMQLGISSFAYGWAASASRAGAPGHDLENPFDAQWLLDRATNFGLRLVQFGDNWPLHDLPADRLHALKQRAEQQRITLEVGARGLTDGRLRQYIDLTHCLNSRLLRFVIDGPGHEPTPTDVIRLLRQYGPVLEQTGVTLGLENHDRLLAAEFADIVAQVNSPNVGICLDTVNSMGAGEGLAEVVRTLAPHTVNLHLKDFGIRRLPHGMGFQIDGRPAGTGMLDIPALVAEVTKHGRCRTAVLEQWAVPESDPATTIETEAAWAEQSIDYLIQTGLFTT